MNFRRVWRNIQKFHVRIEVVVKLVTESMKMWLVFIYIEFITFCFRVNSLTLVSLPDENERYRTISRNNFGYHFEWLLLKMCVSVHIPITFSAFDNRISVDGHSPKSGNRQSLKFITTIWHNWDPTSPYLLTFNEIR